MAGFFLLLVGFSSAFVVHQRNRILPHAFPKALLSTATGDLEDPDENEKRMETVSDLLADTTPIVPKRRWMGGVMKLSVPFVALAGADVALRHVAGEGFRSIVRKMIDARSKFDMRLLSPLLAFFAAMVSFIYRVLDRFPQFTLDNRKEVREEKKLRIELEKENREAQRFKWEQVRTELDMSQVMKLTRKEQQIREEVLQLAQRIAERQST